MINNFDFVLVIFYFMFEVKKKKDDKVLKLLIKEIISRVVLRV